MGLGETGSLDGNSTAAFPWESLDFAGFQVPDDSEKKTQTSDFHVKVFSAASHTHWILSNTFHLTRHQQLRFAITELQCHSDLFDLICI